VASVIVEASGRGAAFAAPDGANAPAAMRPGADDAAVFGNGPDCFFAGRYPRGAPVVVDISFCSKVGRGKIMNVRERVSRSRGWALDR